MRILDFLNKIMPLIIILWIISLIILGVVSYYAQKEIDNQRTKSWRSGISPAVWERMGGCPTGDNRCVQRP